MSKGPIKIAGNVIANEGETIKVKELTDNIMGDVKVSVNYHEQGGRARVTVSSEYSSESRLPRPGDTVSINGVDVEHSE